MNQKQKIILAIFIPIIVFFIALIIANNLGYIERPITEEEAKAKYSSNPTLRKYVTTIRENNPFNWGKTWFVWMSYLILIFIFEYKLFGDKKKKV